MKVLKVLLIVVAVIVLALAALCAVAVLSIDSIAKAGIEKGGTRALGVPTTLQNADVGIFAGKFAMRGLKVGNPPGFPSDHFLTLGEGGVTASLQTLNKPVVELPRLSLNTIDVRLEKKDGKANYTVIIDNLKKIAGPSDGGAPPPSKGDEKKFIVQDLSIRNVTVHADLLGGPVGDIGKVTIPIDEISLQNVGRTGTGGGAGVTMEELAGIVVKAVLAAAVEKGGGVLPAEILGDLKGGLEGLVGLGGSVAEMGLKVVGGAAATVEQIGKEVGKVGEEAKKAAEEIEKGLKDLIPKMN